MASEGSFAAGSSGIQEAGSFRSNPSVFNLPGHLVDARRQHTISTIPRSRHVGGVPETASADAKPGIPGDLRSVQFPALEGPSAELIYAGDAWVRGE